MGPLHPHSSGLASFLSEMKKEETRGQAQVGTQAVVLLSTIDRSEDQSHSRREGGAYVSLTLFI